MRHTVRILIMACILATSGCAMRELVGFFTGGADNSDQHKMTNWNAKNSVLISREPEPISR